MRGRRDPSWSDTLDIVLVGLVEQSVRRVIEALALGTGMGDRRWKRDLESGSRRELEAGRT